MNAYVCVIKHDNHIYKFDNQLYKTSSGAEKRCTQLNENINKKMVNIQWLELTTGMD